MQAGFKKIGFEVVRVGICVGAFWFVLSSVSLHDKVTLNDGTILSGTVTESPDSIIVRPPDGFAAEFARSELGDPGDGASSVTYGLLSTWRTSDKTGLLIGLLIFGLVPFLQAYRIKLLVAAEGIYISFADGIRLSFTGNFLNFAAPFGSTAGDVFKAYYLARYTSRKTEAMTLVFVDRAIGLGTLLGAVAVVTLFSAHHSPLAPLRGYILGFTALGVTAAAAYLSPRVRRLALVRTFAAKLPKGDLLARVDQVVVRLWQRQGVLWRAVGATLVLQVLCAVSFVALCSALGMRTLVSDSVNYFTFFSAGELVKALPGPPQGFGTAELAYTYFFSAFGSVSQILSAGFAMRLVMLVCALPGLAFAASNACRPRTVESSSEIGFPSQLLQAE